MTMSLYWEPADRKMYDLPDALKFVLRKRYGFPVHERMDESDIPYLKGLCDADIEGAQALIDAIEKFGAVVVQEK